MRDGWYVDLIGLMLMEWCFLTWCAPALRRAVYNFLFENPNVHS
jgi:hypothetical protein